LTLASFRHARPRHSPRASQTVLSHFDDTPKRENGWECMEIIQGKQTRIIDAATLAARIAGYQQIAIDIGTGDGRYVWDVARRCPASFVIGVDACRENLRAVSRAAPDNVLFVIANALALPDTLHGLATQITINFPWGSLLAGLLDGNAAFLAGLSALARPGAALEIRLNGGALAEAGYTMDVGVTRIRQTLNAGGFTLRQSLALDADALRACPTTWAKRLAYGRDPSGWYLSATWRTLCVERAGGVLHPDVAYG
jgi:16S rRNA (adenine(1408)-N(1))-methyltransferase